MLDCAMSGCDAHEQTLRSGSLHLLDVPTAENRFVKRIVWLCPDCSRKYVVQTWRAPGQQIQLREAKRSRLPASMLPARCVASVKRIQSRIDLYSAA